MMVLSEPTSAVVVPPLSSSLSVSTTDLVERNVEKTTPQPRKRDVVRQVTMRLYLKGKDIAEDVLKNVALQRMEDAENVCNTISSSLEYEIRASRKARKHLWLPKTQDDSVLLESHSKGRIQRSPLLYAKAPSLMNVCSYRIHAS